jgi:hypothetical protein
MLNDKGEQVIADEGEIVGQGTDEGSIFDDVEDIKDEDLEVDETVEPTADAAEESTGSIVEEKRQNQLEKRLNEMAEQRQAAEAKNETLSRRLYDIEKSTALEKATRANSEYEEKVLAANNKKAIYLEDGNFSAAADIDEEIFKLRNDKTKNDEYISNISRAEYVPDVPEQAPTELPKEQIDWMERNKWFNKLQGKTAYANDTYDELVADGMDPDSAELYAELDRRIGNTSSAPTQSNRSERAPAPSGVEQGATPPAQRKNVLTNDDLNRMRQWGLDTNDKQARAEWLRNKRKAS